VAQYFDLFTGYPFRYLYDESQEVARAYKAACTPEFYLADANLKLFYHGQFDNSRPSNDVLVTGRSEDVFHMRDVQAYQTVILGHIYLPSSPLGSCSACCQCETSQVATLFL